MPRRPTTSMDPWTAAQDELDRQYEHEAPGERPLWPPSPIFPLAHHGTCEPHHGYDSSHGGVHQTPTAASPSPPAAAVGVSVPGDPE